jgi:hypothetical protein
MNHINHFIKDYVSGNGTEVMVDRCLNCFWPTPLDAQNKPVSTVSREAAKTALVWGSYSLIAAGTLANPCLPLVASAPLFVFGTIPFVKPLVSRVKFHVEACSGLPVWKKVAAITVLGLSTLLQIGATQGLAKITNSTLLPLSSIIFSNLPLGISLLSTSKLEFNRNRVRREISPSNELQSIVAKDIQALKVEIGDLTAEMRRREKFLQMHPKFLKAVNAEIMANPHLIDSETIQKIKASETQKQTTSPDNSAVASPVMSDEEEIRLRGELTVRRNNLKYILDEEARLFQRSPEIFRLFSEYQISANVA